MSDIKVQLKNFGDNLFCIGIDDKVKIFPVTKDVMIAKGVSLLEVEKLIRLAKVQNEIVRKYELKIIDTHHIQFHTQVFGHVFKWTRPIINNEWTRLF